MLERCAADAARKLMARGYSKEEAIRISSEMAVVAMKKKYPGGFGGIPVTPEPLDSLSAESQAAAAIPIIKTMREAISPWLWLTSLIGFGMGLLNSRRIAKMYGDWHRKQRAKK
jgi:hypothetical protein